MRQVLTPRGSGAFSVVKEATSKRSGKKYAVKIIEKQNAGQDMARLRTEMEILKSVRHRNIIALKEILEDDQTLYIVTELYVPRWGKRAGNGVAEEKSAAVRWE